MPYKAKNMKTMPPDATENRSSRNSARFSIGLVERISHQRKTPRSTAAMAKASSVSALAQPWSGASMMAYTSVPRPRIDSSAPGGSSLPSSGSRDVGRMKRPAMRAPMTIGTFR